MSNGFDCEDYYEDHCFMVRLPRGATEPVAFFEVLGRRPSTLERDWAPECILRGTLPRERWDVISGEVRAEFNRRLKSERKRSGRWAAGNNGVQRLLGKELLVLAWAIEQDDVTEEQALTAIRNWLGLKPEERWWLYTMTAAATGLASHKGMGWRSALRHALAFGTDKDGVNLNVIGERGQLPPRPNPVYGVRENPNQARTEAQFLREMIDRGRLSVA